MNKRQIFIDQLTLLLLCGVLYTTMLGGSRLWDWDEAINASTAREMFLKNDWGVPRFNDDLNYNKPIMVTLGIILSFTTFGITEFAARFPSALWGLGTVLLLYRISLYLFNRPIAFRSAFVLATMLLFCVEARAATPDAVLIFWSTASILFYIIGTFKLKTTEDLETNSPPVLRIPDCYFPNELRFLVPMYASMGVAVLAKGPVGFVLPCAVIGLFLLLKRLPKQNPEELQKHPGTKQYSILRIISPVHFFETCLSMRLLLGACVILLVAAPWYIWVGIKTDWDWPAVFLLKHNVGRAMAPMEGHRGPFFFYIFALLFDTFPWSIFFLPVCIDTVKRLKRGTPFADGLIFSLCWSSVIIFAFSCAATKLPNYIATMFPAAAMVYALFLYYWSKNEEYPAKFWTPFAIGVLVLVGIVLSLFFLLLPRFEPALLPGDEILSLIGIVLALGGIFALYTWYHSTRKHLEITLNVVFVIFLAMLFFWGACRISRHQQYSEMFAVVYSENPNAKIALLNRMEPSWIFYSGGPMKKLNLSQLEAFLTEHRADGYLLVLEEDYEQKIKKTIPLRIVATAPYLLRKKNLMILAPIQDESNKMNEIPQTSEKIQKEH